MLAEIAELEAEPKLAMTPALKSAFRHSMLFPLGAAGTLARVATFRIVAKCSEGREGPVLYRTLVKKRGGCRRNTFWQKVAAGHRSRVSISDLSAFLRRCKKLGS